MKTPGTGFLRFPTPGAEAWLKEFLYEAACSSETLAVVAIGSSVRPAVESVDLDVLVITEAEIRSLNAPVEVDVRQYHAAEIDKKLVQGNDLLGWAVRFGVVLHEKAAFWTSFVDKYQDLLPFPSVAEARGRAAKALRYLEALLTVGDEDAAGEQLLSHLTHLARAELIQHKVYPVSRPELPAQLEGIGDFDLAALLRDAITRRRPAAEIFADLHSIH